MFCFKGESRNYFGTELPVIASFTTLNTNGDVILPETEVKFDAFLSGFAFYMVNPGTISFYVSYLNYNGLMKKN